MSEETRAYINERFNRVFDKLEIINENQTDIKKRVRNLEKDHFKQKGFFIALTCVFGLVTFLLNYYK